MGKIKPGAIFDTFFLAIGFVFMLGYLVYINYSAPEYYTPGLEQLCRDYQDIRFHEILELGEGLGFDKEPTLWSGRQVRFFVRQKEEPVGVNYNQFLSELNGYLVFSESNLLPFMKSHCVVSVTHGRVTRIEPHEVVRSRKTLQN